MNQLANLDLRALQTSPPQPTLANDPSGSPPTIANPLNRLHIPRVPASGIDPGISTSSFSDHRIQSNGKGKQSMSEGQEKLQHTYGQTQNPKQPGMSKATREMLQRVRKMIPPMLPSFHKGMPSSLYSSKS